MLELAEKHAFARPLVNSGRLSTPTPYVHSSLNTADEAAFDSAIAPGTNCPDAPVTVEGREGWFLNQIGSGFVLLVFGEDPGVAAVRCGDIEARVLVVGRDLQDSRGLLAARYDGQDGTTYLLRPDQYAAARWRRFDEDKVRAALARATCQG